MLKKLKYIMSVAVVIGVILPSPALGQKCHHYVEYNGRKLSIKLPDFQKISFGKLDTEPQQIRAAAQLVSLFDMLLTSNCSDLERLRKALPASMEQYLRAIEDDRKENQHLLEIALALSIYQENKSEISKVATTATSALNTASELQKKSSDEQVAQFKLEDIASKFHMTLSRELAQLSTTETPQKRYWELYSPSRREAIKKQLYIVRELLAAALLIDKDKDLGVFVFIPGGNGRLYSPEGFSVSSVEILPPSFSIPIAYGATGVAFEENYDQFLEISDTYTFCLRDAACPKGDAERTQKKARMLLLPRRSIGKVEAKSVAAIPIENTAGDPIAVLTISVYKLLKQPETDLQEACRSQHIQSIAAEIAKLLTLEEVPQPRDSSPSVQPE